MEVLAISLQAKSFFAVKVSYINCRVIYGTHLFIYAWLSMASLLTHTVAHSTSPSLRTEVRGDFNIHGTKYF